jgi:hypothetical protein
MAKMKNGSITKNAEKEPFALMKLPMVLSA